MLQKGPMRFWQAEHFQKQFEAHTGNRLSKWASAIRMVIPIFCDLNLAEIVD